MRQSVEITLGRYSKAADFGWHSSDGWNDNGQDHKWSLDYNC